MSFHFIFLCWLIWLILTYPGSANPDSVIQLKHFYGDLNWTEWQPPFSTLLMGGLFHLGKSMGNPGFGMFLYNLFLYSLFHQQKLPVFPVAIFVLSYRSFIFSSVNIFLCAILSHF